MDIVELVLPISGKNASVRLPTGRDLVEAERIAGDGAGSIALGLALNSRLATIDGHVLPYEDFLELDSQDLGAISEALGKSRAAKEPPAMPPS